MRITIYGPAYERDKCLDRAAELFERAKKHQNTYVAAKVAQWAERNLEEAIEWDSFVK